MQCNDCMHPLWVAARRLEFDNLPDYGVYTRCFAGLALPRSSSCLLAILDRTVHRAQHGPRPSVTCLLVPRQPLPPPRYQLPAAARRQCAPTVSTLGFGTMVRTYG
jgi:hypothetical protein